MEKPLFRASVPLEPRFLVDSHQVVDILYPIHPKVNEGLLSLVYPEWVDFVEGDLPKVDAILTVSRNMIAFVDMQIQPQLTDLPKRLDVEKYVQENMRGWQKGLSLFVDLWLNTMKAVPDLPESDLYAFPAKAKYAKLKPKYDLVKGLLTQG